MSNKTVTIDTKEYNVYATVSEANDYFAASFYSEWPQVPESQKPQLLVTATRLIDKKNYQGEKLEKDQPLKFPRIINGEQTDDVLLTETCCEVAMSLYVNDGISLSGSIASIQSVGLGDSSVSFKEGVNIESDETCIIEDYLSDYLMGGVQVIL